VIICIAGEQATTEGSICVNREEKLKRCFNKLCGSVGC
jgi:hypothetical protein